MLSQAASANTIHHTVRFMFIPGILTRRGSRPNEAADPTQGPHWLRALAGLSQIHFEFGDPVVVLLGIDQHLLHSPGAFVLGRRDIRVAQIARVRVETNLLVLIMVSVPNLPQALRRPWLTFGVLR